MLRNERTGPESQRRNSFCSFSVAMGSKGGDFTAIEIAMVKWEMSEGLKWAIDNSYRRLLDAARHEWEQRFAGPNPSDACVSVRISSPASEASSSTVRCAGYLPKRISPRGGKMQPRLA